MAEVNVTTINNDCVQQAAANLGMGNVGEAGAWKLLSAQLKTNADAAWTADGFGATPPGLNYDSGVMGPWTADAAGTAPQCLVDKLTGDFGTWKIPVDPTAIDAIASKITEEIGSQGGNSGAAGGITSEGSSTQINWVVAYATAPYDDANPQNIGVYYSYVAAYALSEERRKAEAAAASA
jgi:hypothetical protein